MTTRWGTRAAFWYEAPLSQCMLSLWVPVSQTSHSQNKPALPANLGTKVQFFFSLTQGQEPKVGGNKPTRSPLLSFCTRKRMVGSTGWGYVSQGQDIWVSSYT